MDQVWTVSKGAADTLREYGYKGHIEVVPNGTDFDIPDNMEKLIEKTEKKLGINSSDLVFLFVGQHIWQKNIKLLVDSLNYIKEQIPYKMFFVGDGYAKEELESYVQELGLGGKVFFLGKILDRNYLRSLFARADLFLFPSVYDNAPIVVREAAAVGTPSLVIAKSNAAEGIVDNVNGFLSDNDSISYSKRIIEIIRKRDELKNIGNKAQATIYRNWESIVDEVYERYMGIIESYNRKHRIS
jgi:glycosyltransferase involved in cell wall biosynthesis